LKITYTGRQVELKPAQQQKLEDQFAKIGKLLDGKKECEIHVVLSLERHLNHAEATINFYGHQIAGLGSSPDLFTAIHGAAEKLEKQVVKARTKWRDTKRTPRKEEAAAAEEAPVEVEPEAAEEEEAEVPAEQMVHHVNHHDRRKPMTLDEAMLEIDGRDYLVYRDAKSDCVSVLIRRRDGAFDLIEG
jgi:putative sigma-54 modulation protein